MSEQLCTNCGGNELTTDSSRGIVCCEECGMIQEENLIVNTMQFQSGPNNKSSMQGKVVNVENKNIGTKYVDSCYYVKNTIKNICNKLSLTAKHTEISFKWYKLCLANNLTKGKSILYTLSACIYISCIQQGTPMLLIDFSNVLRIDMYQIGKIYLKIRNKFQMADEKDFDKHSLYLQRFVSQLKFIKPREIVLLSTRILNRMKKDWIMEGRKPNNSCGAAILLASRILDEPKDINEIAKVVHAAPATINKRLKEIALTDSAALDVDEFNKEWIDEETQPPILTTKTPRSKRILDESDIVIDDELIIDEMLLNEEEVKGKEILWNEMYGEYVKASEKRKKNRKKPGTRKIVKKHNFETVEEAFKSLDKKVSSKLNYDILHDLFQK